MIPHCFIFDLDDVLAGYDLGKRLAVLEDMTGIAADDIKARLWDSGFEDAADAGAYPDAHSYLDAFNAHLGFSLTRAQWIEARGRAMQPFDDMLGLARKLGRRGTIAVLTNNVPLMQDGLCELLPQAMEVFGERVYFSCAMKLAKPDPQIYLETARACGVAPQHCLFSDDKQENALGAQQAGMIGVQFRSYGQFVAALDAAGVAIA